MKSRDKILGRVKLNQESVKDLRRVDVPAHSFSNVRENFIASLERIGGTVLQIPEEDLIADLISRTFPALREKVQYFSGGAEQNTTNVAAPHDYDKIELAVLKGEFGVAENGAVWITNDHMPDRALPFICEHLVLVISNNAIVPTLFEAYQRIELSVYEYGTFIAGPSKTADIEQSLVLGAHGPKTLAVVIVGAL
jgi:L-lactate dehydrogenase complex protein LldG